MSHAGTWRIPVRLRKSRQETVQKPMAVTLICPKCHAGTELRGTMDAYYLTWCPDCERLWRLELWTLVNADEPERKMPWLTSR
jgi:hypothetical protein